MLTQVKLVDGSREMPLRNRPGVAHVGLDKGFPAVRAVEEEMPDDDGVTDNTARYGAAAVTLTLRLYQQGGTRAVIDELASYCDPAMRPCLIVEDDEWPVARQVKLRADQMSAPIESGKGSIREVQVSWKAPHGVWEAAAEEHLMIPVDIPSSAGMSFPVNFPMSFAPTSAGGAQATTNLGGSRSHLTARLYGPVTAPQLWNDTTGQVLAFTDVLALGAGEYVEVNTRERTAFLLGDIWTSRLNEVDYEISEWWQMQRGVNRIRYTGTNPGLGARAEIFYRPVWLV